MRLHRRTVNQHGVYFIHFSLQRINNNNKKKTNSDAREIRLVINRDHVAYKVSDCVCIYMAEWKDGFKFGVKILSKGLHYDFAHFSGFYVSLSHVQIYFSKANQPTAQIPHKFCRWQSKSEILQIFHQTHIHISHTTHKNMIHANTETLTESTFYVTVHLLTINSWTDNSCTYAILSWNSLGGVQQNLEKLASNNPLAWFPEFEAGTPRRQTNSKIPYFLLSDNSFPPQR